MSRVFYTAGSTSALMKLGIDSTNPRHARIFSPADTAEVQKALAAAGIQPPTPSRTPMAGKPYAGAGTALKPSPTSTPAAMGAARPRRNAVMIPADEARAAMQKAMAEAGSKAKPSMLQRMGKMIGKLR